MVNFNATRSSIRMYNILGFVCFEIFWKGTLERWKIIRVFLECLTFNSRKSCGNTCPRDSQYPSRTKFLIIFPKHEIPTIKVSHSIRIHIHVRNFSLPSRKIKSQKSVQHARFPSYIRNFSLPFPKNQISKICPKYPISIHHACVQKLNPKNLFDISTFRRAKIFIISLLPQKFVEKYPKKKKRKSSPYLTLQRTIVSRKRKEKKKKIEKDRQNSSSRIPTNLPSPDPASTERLNFSQTTFPEAINWTRSRAHRWSFRRLTHTSATRHGTPL